MKAGALTTEQVVRDVKKFLKERGIRIYKVDVAELDEESVLIRVYTNIQLYEEGD